MTVKEFIEQLQQFPEEMEIKYLYTNPFGGYYAEPRVMQSGDRILIMCGKLEVIDNA